jgi:hypothetical protein
MLKLLATIMISLIFLVSQLGLASSVGFADETKSVCQHCDCGGSSCCVEDSVPQQDIPPIVPWSAEKIEDYQQLQNVASIRPLSLTRGSKDNVFPKDRDKYQAANVPIFLFISSFLI